MKRDMDLIRKLLLAVEANEHAAAPQKIEIDGYTAEAIGYHAFLLGEAGLADVVSSTHHQRESPEARILHLTWAGHDFLDTARENQAWEQARDMIEKTGGASIQMWEQLLADIKKRQLNLK